MCPICSVDLCLIHCYHEHLSGMHMVIGCVYSEAKNTFCRRHCDVCMYMCIEYAQSGVSSSGSQGKQSIGLLQVRRCRYKATTHIICLQKYENVCGTSRIGDSTEYSYMRVRYMQNTRAAAWRVQCDACSVTRAVWRVQCDACSVTRAWQNTCMLGTWKKEDLHMIHAQEISIRWRQDLCKGTCPG